jgi:small subunit ribosomal protein S16
MVIIRLARHGSKNAPFYHLTVADRANRRDGRHVERVGFYNPLARGKAERLRIDLARIDYWLSVGAQPSERVSHLIKEARALASAAVGAANAA